MLQLGRLKQGMASAFALAGASFVASPVLAQDAPTPTQVAMVSINHNVPIVEDADYAANEYVVDRPQRFAVSVRIGEDTLVPAERVEEVLRDDLEGLGRTNVEFYFERGGPGDTTVSYHTTGRVFGSYPLATARDQIPYVIEQTSFNQQFAANMN